VNVNVKSRGVRQTVAYRLVGTSIVKNNLVKILMNEYEYCGDIRYLEYDLLKSTSFFIMQKVIPVYNAYLRADYLFALKSKKENELEIQQSRPIFICENKSMKVGISRDGILLPVTTRFTNHELVEEEIHTGKEIAMRFVLNKKSTQAFINAQNPVMAVIISAIPMLIMVGLSAIVIYLGYSGAADLYEKAIAAGVGCS
jgi:hypothetical protein